MSICVYLLRAETSLRETGYILILYIKIGCYTFRCIIVKKYELPSRRSIMITALQVKVCLREQKWS